ncbi:MAG: hypothetical protein ACK4S4_08450 [Pyrinomonadaceae bacterium]
MKSDKINSTNFHGDEEQRLAGLLASLPQVGAPSDFEFRVKARIATRRGETSLIRRVPASLRLALPLLLFFLTGVAAIFYFSWPDALTPGEAVQPAASAVADPAPAQPAPVADPSVQTELPSPEVATGTESSLPGTEAGKTAAARSGAAPRERRPAGGSMDVSLGQAEAISPTDAPQRSRNGLSADQVLLQLGAKTVFENDGYRVLVVEDSSIAKIAGVEKDDVVQKIGKQKITDRTNLRNLKAENITVLRKGEVKTLPLKPAAPSAPQQQKN